MESSPCGMITSFFLTMTSTRTPSAKERRLSGLPNILADLFAVNSMASACPSIML